VKGGGTEIDRQSLDFVVQSAITSKFDC